MKYILNKLKDGIIIGIGFLLIVFLGGISYAVWVNVGNVNTGDTLTAELFNNVINNQKSLVGIGDYGYKEGPTSYSSDYINVWNNGGGGGDSIDCTSVTTGCKILKDGIYEVSCVQRSNGTSDPFVAIALNGNRTILETNSNAMWGHDHMTNANGWAKAEYLGNLGVNNIITCGPPSTYSSDLLYSVEGYTGLIKIIRIK